MLKKLFSFILVIFASSILFVSCGNTNTDYKTIISSTDVALLSLFTFDGKGESKYGLVNLGHSFLAVENISEDSINIGQVEIEPHKTITIGAWSIASHFGIWYNVESNYIKFYNKYDGRISITTGVDKSDLETIAKYIKQNDTWTPLKNCSNFALNVWNKVADKSEELVKPIIYSPTKIAKNLKKFEKYEINKKLITDDNFYYLDGKTPRYYKLKV